MLYRRRCQQVWFKAANIHKALDYAVMSGLVDKNSSDYVILPRKKKFVGKYFDQKQLNRLFAVSKDYTIEAIVKLTGYYGFRRSEVLGLRWTVINFNDDTNIVQNTVVSIGGKAFESFSRCKIKCFTEMYMLIMISFVNKKTENHSSLIM
jgi:integrase